MKFVSLLVALVIGYLTYDLWFGRNGIEQYHAVSAQVEEARHKSEKLTLRNQALEDEIKDLKQGDLTVEELARDDLGMIKSDETFFRVIDSKTRNSSESVR